MNFDPNRFRDRLREYIVVADGEFDAKYSKEIMKLTGLSAAQIAEFSGTVEQRDAIITELEKAKQTNLAQAQLIGNIKALGENTYELARKLSDLIP